MASDESYTNHQSPGDQTTDQGNKLRQGKIPQRLCAKTFVESAWSVTYIALKMNLCPGLRHPMRGRWAKGEKPWRPFPFKL